MFMTMWLWSKNRRTGHNDELVAGGPSLSNHNNCTWARVLSATKMPGHFLLAGIQNVSQADRLFQFARVQGRPSRSAAELQSLI